jgi:hypothetical protein
VRENQVKKHWLVLCAHTWLRWSVENCLPEAVWKECSARRHGKSDSVAIAYIRKLISHTMHAVSTTLLALM